MDEHHQAEHGNELYVSFLTLNDVYELLPDANGRGGVAKMAALIEQEKSKILAKPNHVCFVTLNGDFLWQCQYDRQDKGELMVEVLNLFQVDFVVLGNHELDFGADTLSQLLTKARFTTFGSNVFVSKQTSNASKLKLLDGLHDTLVVDLPYGLKMGLFGLLTTDTIKENAVLRNSDSGLVLDDEMATARKCLQKLHSGDGLDEHHVDLIVVVTHLEMAKDRALARTFGDIDLILGGHDHIPMTCFEKHTLIHKSGCDALWLGKVDLHITKKKHQHIRKDKAASGNSGRGATKTCGARRVPKRHRVHISYQWHMIANGSDITPDPVCDTLVSRYLQRVEHDETKQGLLVPLATLGGYMDGTRLSLRCKESNLANFLADTVRSALQVDYVVLHGSLIKADRWHEPQTVVTKRWIQSILPLPKEIVVVHVTMQELLLLLNAMVKHHPVMHNLFPHVSGCRVVVDSKTNNVVKIVGEEQSGVDSVADHSRRWSLGIAHTVLKQVQLAGASTSEHIASDGDPCSPFPIVSRHGNAADLVSDFLTKQAMTLMDSCTTDDGTGEDAEDLRTVLYSLTEQRIQFVESYPHG